MKVDQHKKVYQRVRKNNNEYYFWNEEWNKVGSKDK